jgi:hypothetical protein
MIQFMSLIKEQDQSIIVHRVRPIQQIILWFKMDKLLANIMAVFIQIQFLLQIIIQLQIL